MRTVRIGTQDVVVEFVPMVDGEFGVFHAFPSPRISVNSSLPVEVQRLTLLHELIHAISDMYGLGLSEAQVRAMEQGLGQVMSEPDVWEWIGGRH